MRLCAYFYAGSQRLRTIEIIFRIDGYKLNLRCGLTHLLRCREIKLSEVCIEVTTKCHQLSIIAQNIHFILRKCNGITVFCLIGKVAILVLLKTTILRESVLGNTCNNIRLRLNKRNRLVDIAEHQIILTPYISRTTGRGHTLLIGIEPTIRITRKRHIA